MESLNDQFKTALHSLSRAQTFLKASEGVIQKWTPVILKETRFYAQVLLCVAFGTLSGLLYGLSDALDMISTHTEPLDEYAIQEAYEDEVATRVAMGVPLGDPEELTRVITAELQADQDECNHASFEEAVTLSFREFKNSFGELKISLEAIITQPQEAHVFVPSPGSLGDSVNDSGWVSQEPNPIYSEGSEPGYPQNHS